MTRKEAFARLATMTAPQGAVEKARRLIGDPLTPPPDELAQDADGRILVQYWGFDGNWFEIIC